MQAGNQTGFSIQQRSGDQNQLDSQAQQQMIASLLKNALATPQRPELSWTQGLARMLEAGVSAYKQKQLDTKNQQTANVRANDAKLLGAALTSNDPRQIALAMQQMKDPQSQSMGLNVLTAMQNNNQLNQNEIAKEGRMSSYRQKESQQKYGQTLGEKDFENSLQNQTKSQQNQFDLTKAGVENTLNTQRDTSKIQQEAQKDPIKAAQAQAFQYQSVLDNPNAPEPIKALAKQKLDGQMQILMQLKTNLDPNAVAMTGTGIAGNGRMGGGGGGGTGAKSSGGGAAPDIQARAVSARDLLSNLKQSMNDIETGKLKSQDMTSVGQLGNYIAGANELGGSEAEIGRYKQVSSQQTLEAIREMQAAGGASRLPKTLIDILQQSKFSPDELPNAAYPKMFMQMQALDRLSGIGQLQQQWIDKNGGIDKKDPSGQTWEQVLNKFNDSNPIVSYPDYLKNNQALVMTQKDHAPQTNPDQSQPNNQGLSQGAVAQSAPPQQNTPLAQTQDVSQKQPQQSQDSAPQSIPDVAPQQKPPQPPMPDQSIPNPSQSMIAPQNVAMNVNQPPIDQQQMLAMALARKQQMPDYSSMFADNPNISI